MLMHASPGGVVLTVEQVLHLHGQCIHLGTEVRALKVRHGIESLLPYGVLLILNHEKCDRQCCCSREVALIEGGEGDVCHHLDGGVRLAVDDGPRARLRGVKGYRHTDLAHIQAIGHRLAVAVDRSVPIVAHYYREGHL
jgi:hypothetical protein